MPNEFKGKVLRRSFIAMLCFALSMTFSGCYDSNSSNNKTINVWLSATPKELSFFSEIASEFETKNSGYSVKFREIKFQDLKPSFVYSGKTNTGPDMILIPNDWIGELAKEQLIVPVDLSIASYTSSIAKSVTYQSKSYGFPLSFEALALIYNKDLQLVPPQTFDEMASSSQKLLEKGIYPLMYDNKNFYFHAPFFFACGGKLFDEGKLIFSESELKASVNEVISLQIDKKLVPPESNQAATVNLFCSGKVAMMINGPWVLQELDKNRINYAVTVLPGISDKKLLRSFVGVKCFALTSNSKEKNKAEEFAKLLCSKNVQKAAMDKISILPCQSSVFNEKFISGKYKGFFMQAKNGIPLPSNPAMKFVWNEANLMLRKCFLEPKKAPEYISNTRSRIFKLIDKAKGAK